MRPLGNKILVRDVKEDGVDKVGSLTIKTVSSGLITAAAEHYRKVKVVDVSAESQAKYKKEYGVDYPLSIGDICLCNPGGVEVEDGLWLCNEGLLDSVL